MKSEQPSVFDSLIDPDRSATPFDSVLVRMLADRLLAWPEGRGFKALIENFRDADMGREVDSWLGPTSPRVISPTALRRVIGPRRVLDEDWLREVVTAAKAPEAEVVQCYADMIPKMVKALTPRGEIPSARVLAAGFEAMRRRSASRAS